MNYWQGYMNWPLEEGWKCDICGGYFGLTWGLIHAECRCNACHALYFMRAPDKEETVLIRPRLVLKEAFIIPAKEAFAQTGKFLGDLTKEEWIAFGVPAEQFNEEKTEETK